MVIMSYGSKIRMSIGWVYPIGILISYILIIVELAIRKYLFGNGLDIGRLPYLTIFLVSAFFIVLGIIQWFRYRNWINPVLGFLIGITTLQISFIYGGFGLIFKLSYFASFIIMVLFIIINWQSFYSETRFEINSRRLFRLASERIYEVDEGYTGRPYAAGQISFGKDELLGFVRFLHGSYVVRPFYHNDYVSLAFSMNKSLVVIKDPSEVSHIILNHNGEIRVIISEKDYRDYNERLSFDQLCSAMAEVFIRFFDYYKEGHESRIISELKSAR